ncbi:hypothetical protein ACW7G2_13925 [Luteimonas sp. A277]
MSPLALLLIFLLPGCVSFDSSRYEGVSRFGANGQTIARLGPFFRSKSMYFIPGQAESKKPSQRVQCADKRVQLRLVLGDEKSLHYADELCEAASAALVFLDRQMGKADVRFRIDVIPEGLSRSFLGTRYGKYPNLTFAIPYFPDRELMLRNVIDLIGHEGFHVYASISGQELRSSNEFIAYMHGLCAQLDVIGNIHEGFLPGAAMQLQVASSSAAEATRQFIEPLLENGSIRVNTASALQIIERCEADE